MEKYLSYESYLNPDNFYTKKEIIDQYGVPFSKSFDSTLVTKNEELFTSYKTDDLILVNEEEEKYISKKLIHDALSDEGMFRYIQTNLNNDLGIAIKIDYIIGNDSVVTIKLNRRELIKACDELSSEMSQKEQMRFALIKSSWLIYSCEQRYRDYTHKAYIDGTTLGIPANILLNILTCDEKTFANFLNGTINYGYDKECLAYSLVDFIERERILTKYVLPDKVYDRYESIRNYSLIDFESLNKNRIRNDIGANGESIIEGINISDELMDYLDKEINPTYSKLEKIIYYYLKLCEVLSYDQTYFLTEAQNILELHEDIEKVNSITPSNNEIIKYDFILIFTKLLATLKIDYTIDQNLMVGNTVAGPMLTFRYGEYLVSLRSFNDPSKSDLINVKLNDEIINLTCMNKNEFTKKKFEELVSRIYEDINIKRKQNQTFKESLEKYKANNNNKSVSFKERLFILLTEISKSNLKGIDAIGYEKKIIENLFPDNNRIKVNYLCRESKKNYLTPITIISVLDNDEYVYYMIEHIDEQPFSRVTQDELMTYLGLGGLYYVDDNKIPGLDTSVGEKYVR